ncbi:MAG: tyrosine-type recombinase/integrase [Fuerstiella sp.]
MTVRSSTSKPAKPYKEFPLFAHGNGQWAKKIRGKLWYFGKWEDSEAALRQYLDDVDEIQAGREPRRARNKRGSSDTMTVAEMVNLFLAVMDARRKSGEITNRHWADYKRSCQIIVDHFGRRLPVTALRAADFASLRQSFPKSWGPTKTATEIQRMRTAFRWAAESEVINALPNFGPDFRKPSRTAHRRTAQQRQAKHGRLAFSQQELRTILENCNGWLRASVLLGANAGFGAADCGRLRVQNIDFDNGWYDLPRPKTGIPRRFYVWPETRSAIREAMAERPIAKNDDHDDLCFLTSHGRPVWWETDKGSKCDNIGKAFLTLCRKLDASEHIRQQRFDRPGRNFYSLRRTYETIAGNTRDQVAVNYAMGHCDDSMAAVYRQGIDDRRLIDVAEFVRHWLWPKPSAPSTIIAPGKVDSSPPD